MLPSPAPVSQLYQIQVVVYFSACSPFLLADVSPHLSGCSRLPRISRRKITLTLNWEMLLSNWCVVIPFVFLVIGLDHGTWHHSDRNKTLRNLLRGLLQRFFCCCSHWLKETHRNTPQSYHTWGAGCDAWNCGSHPVITRASNVRMEEQKDERNLSPWWHHLSNWSHPPEAALPLGSLFFDLKKCF